MNHVHSGCREIQQEKTEEKMDLVLLHLALLTGASGYLIEAPSRRILLAGSKLLQLSVEDIHQLLHQAHCGGNVSGKDWAFGVLG